MPCFYNESRSWKAKEALWWEEGEQLTIIASEGQPGFPNSTFRNDSLKKVDRPWCWDVISYTPWHTKDWMNLFSSFKTCEHVCAHRVCVFCFFLKVWSHTLDELICACVHSATLKCPHLWMLMLSLLVSSSLVLCQFFFSLHHFLCLWGCKCHS